MFSFALQKIPGNTGQDFERVGITPGWYGMENSQKPEMGSNFRVEGWGPDLAVAPLDLLG